MNSEEWGQAVFAKFQEMEGWFDGFLLGDVCDLDTVPY